MAEKLSFLIIIIIASLALFFIFYDIITPDMHKNVDPSKPIGYIFVPDNDEFEDRKHLLIISVINFKNVDIKGVYAKFKRKREDDFRSTALINVNKGVNWVGELPTLPKGERYFYYIEIDYEMEGKLSTIVIPEWAPNKPLLFVTYEGKPNKYLLLLHIVLVMGAAIFLLHTLFYSIRCLWEKDKTKSVNCFTKAYKSVIWGWISFTVSTLLIGYYISLQVFGKGWNGLPIGDDITDNKSLLMVIFWGILLLLKSDSRYKFMLFKRVITIRTFCIMIIIGVILTAIVYLIPHSYFFQ